jgi:hypothetical protein
MMNKPWPYSCAALIAKAFIPYSDPCAFVGLSANVGTTFKVGKKDAGRLRGQIIRTEKQKQEK